MATIKNGILGGFSGKVAKVVGVQNGENCYMRSLPKARTKFTVNELQNQAKMKMVQAYLSPLKDLLKVGFHQYYTKTGGFRGALSYTRKEAMVTDDNGFYIDPALLKISGGDLAPAINPTFILMNNLELQLNWDTTDVNYLNEADQLMVLIYDPIKGFAQTKIFNGAFRKDGELTIPLKHQFKNAVVNIYIGFVAAERDSQSDSQFLGSVLVN